MLEQKLWSNKHYSQREWLKMSGLPTSAGNSPLKGNVLENFEKMDAKVDPQNVEACY